MKQLAQFSLLLALVALAANAANAKKVTVAVHCGQADKPKGRALFDRSKLPSRSVMGYVKCGDKVTVTGLEDQDMIPVKTNDGREGYLIADALEQKAKGARQQPNSEPKRNGVLNTLSAVMAGAANGAAAANPPTPNPSPAASTTALLLFGGDDHRVFLGCLNCSQYDTDSVQNAYGTYGSKYSGESILNHFSEYGSQFSSDGACNKFASDPPVIVDKMGNYYGRLTLNPYANEIGVGTRFMGWLAAVCQD